jgi:bacterioferritin-associated ferredoxin
VKDDDIVCVCHEVTAGLIRELARRYRTFEELRAAGTLCQTCEGCEYDVRQLVWEVHER